EIEGNESELSIRVRDNGKGFDPRNTGKGMGLKTMKNRSRFIGGRLEVSSGRKGTTVECVVPL
ncbi:MAG: sensor histidine kinase, partial [Spirochaetia bacterium]